MRLPEKPDPAQFDTRYRLQPEEWLEAVREVCEAHRIRFEPAEPFTDGSNLVAAVGDDYVVKIFPPFHRHQWESEHRVLGHLQGRLTLPIPELVASGQRDDGWTYVVVGRVRGRSLEEVWPTLEASDKAQLLEQIGAAIAEVQRVPVGALRGLDPPWSEFLTAQVAGCRSRHQRLGMPPWFVEGVDRYVADALHLLPAQFEPVVLTGEYTPFNLLVEKGARWTLSGMIDFGDAMVGYPEYDLLGPIAFLAAGDRGLVRSLLAGRGYLENQRDQALRRRLLLLLVLHRYSNLAVQVRVPGWQSNVSDFEALEQWVFPF